MKQIYYITLGLLSLFVIGGCGNNSNNQTSKESEKEEQEVVNMNYAPTHHYDKDGVPWSNSNIFAPREDETVEEANKRLGIGGGSSAYEEGYEDGYDDGRNGYSSRY